MIKYCAFFFNIIFISLSVVGMDQYHGHIKKIIYAPEGKQINEITFINSDHIVINGHAQDASRDQIRHNSYNPQLINLVTGQATGFLVPSDKMNAALCLLQADSHKKRVGMLDIGYGETSNTITIYDSETKKTYMSKLPNTTFGWRFFFNSEPDRILLYQQGCREMISLDYINDKTEPHKLINEFFAAHKKLYLHEYFPKTNCLCVVDDNYSYKYDLVSGLFHKLITMGDRGITEYSYSQDESVMVLKRLCYDCFDQPRGRRHFDNCNCNKCYIIDLRNNNCFSLENDDHAQCAMDIHPNNKFIATMSDVDYRIRYWSAQTGECVTQQQCPVPEYDGSIPKDYRSRYLSFSADGAMLAAAQFKQCLILHVPFEVIYLPEAKNKFALLLFLLENYQINDNLLAEDVVKLLEGNIIKVLKY